jgi:WD40 repeat protein
MTRSNRPAYRYQAGGSLGANDPTYVYRQADEALYDRLKEGDFCYVFNCRQMGKSSLGTQIMGRLITEGICCVRVDLSAIGSSGVSMAEWYRSLIGALHDDVTELVDAGISEAMADLDLEAWQAKYEALMRAEGISAVRLFNRYLKEILLGAMPQQRFMIFIDEIDSVLDLEDSSDFFGLIRACFNRRADNADYQRLTFALFGVATPGRLIRDVNKTPFNLGKAIVLTGFELERSLVLTEGMNGVVPDPVAVLREILAWTGGQPFLTQKLCDWVQMGEKGMPELVAGEEAAWVAQLVEQHLIANWKFEDDPQHFRTIENFILRDEREGDERKSGVSHKAVQLLGLYQQVLQVGEIEADESEAQTDLCLSGLVVRDRGKLRVYNRIYQRVFDLGWVEDSLKSQGVTPDEYSPSLQAWLETQDEKYLLQGDSLTLALEWAERNRIREVDNRFLIASQAYLQRRLNQEVVVANQDLERTNKRIQIGYLILSGVIGVAMMAGVGAMMARRDADTQRQVTQLEKDGLDALKRSEYEQIQGLLDAMRAGQNLQKLMRERGSEGFTASPSYALQSILDLVENRAAQSFHQTLLAHKGEINTAEFIPDGQQAVTDSSDQPAQIREAKTAVFSPDKQRIVTTASNDKTVRIWDAKSGQEIVQLKGHEDSVNTAVFSPDGQWIITASNDRTARVWDAKSGKELALLKGMPVSNDKVIAWDAKTGQEFSQRKGHENFTTESSSSDNQRLMTASDDKTVIAWDIRTGEEFSQRKGHAQSVSKAAFSPDGQRVVTASADNTARIWDAKTGKEIALLEGHEDAVTDVAFSPDGQRVVTASADNTARIWHVKSGKAIAQLKGHESTVNTAAFSSDGQRVVTTSKDETVRVWDAKEIDQGLAQLKGHEGFTPREVFSPDGQRSVTLNHLDKVPRVLDTKSGKEIAQLKGHTDGVNTAAFSPDSQRIVTTSSDRTARVWDAKSGQEIAQLKGHKKVIGTAIFSPDSQRIVTSASTMLESSSDGFTDQDYTARVWDAKSGQEIAQLKGHTSSVYTATFSPDSQRIVTASDDKTARVWNAKSGQEITQFKGHEGFVYTAAFSPDGQRVVTASADRTARIWNMTGQEIAQLKGHRNRVNVAAFSPDGQLVVTGSLDQTVRVWDAKSGQEIAQLKGLKNDVVTAKFSSDGQRIIADSNVEDRRIWPVESLETLLNRGCSWLKNYLIANPQTLNSLTTCQTSAITQAALSNLITQSEAHARAGRLTEAIQGFTLAKQWNPNLPFDPKTHAEKLAQAANPKP